MRTKWITYAKQSTLHLIFWIGVWFFFYYFFSYNSEDTTYVTWFSSCLLPISAAVTYFFSKRIIPRYLLTKQYVQFTLYSFYTLVASSYITVLAIYACLIFLLKFNVAVMPPMSKNFLFILILEYMVVGGICFISILKHNFKTDAKNKDLENKILATQLQLKEQELNYLKQQIHPHFLFNTLNTIYGFALKQSKQTPDIILKLSNLLDYILYQINKPMVSLKEEVLHIEEYVALEKVRFQDNLRVIMDFDSIDQQIQVAPMLLIPFVENAFKHGEIVNGFLDIRMICKVKNDELHFTIINSLKHTDEIDKQNGIGLKNIQKRLKINYNKQYKLSTIVEQESFKVELILSQLKKASNV